LHEITITEIEPGSTGVLLTQHLGFERAGEDLYVLGSARVHVTHDPNAARGMVGPGGVHHVAFAVASQEEQAELRAKLTAAGFKVTLVQDRVYFQSIYFRQPRGILFEIATIQPGFFADEQTLGSRLCLPPWLEGSRASIAERLAPLKVTPHG
jgi:glyoxalase family protein